MKKGLLGLISIALVASSFGLVSCSGSGSTNSSNKISNTSQADEFESIKKGYGEFLVENKSGEKNYTLENNVLTLTAIDTYTLSGYFKGKIVYQLDDTVAKSNTGVIVMNTLFIDSGENIAIEWTSKKGTLELKSEKDSINYIVSEGVSGEKIQAVKCNNLDIRGSGETLIKSNNHNAIKAQDVSIRKTKLTIEAYKNGISCENITFNSGDVTIKNCDRALNVEENEDKTLKGETTGVLTVEKKVAEDGTYGSLNVLIKSCKVAFKVETSFINSFGKDVFNVQDCQVVDYVGNVDSSLYTVK